MFLSIDGGFSWIFSFGTSQGARRRRFLTLMMDSPESPTPVRRRHFNRTKHMENGTHERSYFYLCCSCRS
jgi:hypothetical protein